VPAPLVVRAITKDEHLSFVDQASGSFLQTPAWGQLKSDWSHDSIGWFAADELVGAALVLYRQTPVVKRFLAYLPEGPVIDWQAFGFAAVAEPLVQHVRKAGAFTVKIGPHVPARRWRADTIKAAIAAGEAKRLGSVDPDTTNGFAADMVQQLRAAGWQRDDAAATAGFGDLQPRYVFHVPLGGRTLDEIFAGFNQLWRRNVRKAEKSGVQVSLGGFDDLEAFHLVYAETAARDGFTPRPLSYFHRMWRAMADEDPDRLRVYLAHHEGELLAATTWVRVNKHVWYSYGASSNHKRELRPSNAIQWRMITDAHEAGADVYDLRGISDTLDESDPLFGLIRFKVGTGGEAVEYVGEWDYPVNRLLHRGFKWYLGRR